MDPYEQTVDDYESQGSPAQRPRRIDGTSVNFDRNGSTRTMESVPHFDLSSQSSNPNLNLNRQMNVTMNPDGNRNLKSEFPNCFRR